MEKISVSVLVLIGGLLNVGNAEEERTPYQQWISHMENGNYESGLKVGSKLLHQLTAFTPDQDYIYEEHVGLLYDLANNLIYLKRWQEAKYCLTRFLIEAQTDKELEATFGVEFSRQEWLKENRLVDQPFLIMIKG